MKDPRNDPDRKGTRRHLSRQVASPVPRQETARRSTRAKKPALTRRARMIQAAIYLSPLAILILLGVIRLAGGGTPTADRVADTRESGPSPDPESTGEPSGAGDLGEDPDPIDPTETGEDPSHEARILVERATDGFEAAFARLREKKTPPLEARRPLRELAAMLDEAIELEPEFAAGLLLRGRVRSLLDDPKGAIEDFDLALSADPENTQARLARGKERFRAHWREMIRLGAWWESRMVWPHARFLDGAKEDFDRVSRSGNGRLPDDVLPLVAFIDQRLDRVMELLGSDPLQDEELSFLRGWLFHWEAMAVHERSAREFDAMLQAALADLGKAVELRWHFVDAWIHLSRCLLSVGRHEEAIKSLEGLVRLFPDDPLLSYSLGYAYTTWAPLLDDSGKTEDAARLNSIALSIFEHTLELDPDFASARVDRADIIAFRGNTSGALLEVDRALPASPRAIRALYLAANLTSLDPRRRSESVTLATRALAIRPEIWDLHLLRARVLKALGRRAEAVEGLQAALALGPPASVRQALEDELKR